MYIFVLIYDDQELEVYTIQLLLLLLLLFIAIEFSLGDSSSYTSNK